jgi:azurin
VKSRASSRLRTLLPWALALAGWGSAAQAANCELTIDANDMIQFTSRALQVDPACSAVQLTLRHECQPTASAALRGRAGHSS